MTIERSHSPSGDDGSPRSPLSGGAVRLGSTWINLVLLGITVLLLLGVVEMTLRATGFNFVLKPEDIEFGRPDPVMLEVGFEEDDEVFWVPKGYDAELRRLAEERPPLILMGDSCTHLGHYDEYLAERVRERRGASLSYGNVAVVGWSTYQGRRQLERDVAPLRPRVITLYFGWNDHWIGFGLEDEMVAQVKHVFSSRWSRFRLVQLLTKAMVAYRARETQYPNRVSLADFEDNLTAMVEEARSVGAVPVILTAASNHRLGKEPKSLKRRWLRNTADLVPLHQSYVRAQRAVAERLGAPLCDLEEELSRLTYKERKKLFMGDGIHFKKAGDRRVAELLDQCFEREGLWPLLLDP